MELVDSVDDLKSSCSVRGSEKPNSEVLDARIASALNKIIHNSHFKRRISLEEQKAQKEDRFFRGRQIAYLIYDQFRVIGTNDSVENCADIFTVVLRNMTFRNLIQSGQESWRLAVSTTSSGLASSPTYKTEPATEPGRAWVSAAYAAHSWISQLEHGETCSAAEAIRWHDACVHAVLVGLKLADPGVTTEPRGLTEAESRTADLFTTAAVPGRSAAWDVCEASADASADFRDQGILCHPLVWTADGRPHPEVTRTLQYAADIASCRNGQHMSAKSRQHRWRHDIQIALFRRRATMTQAVLPNPSARAEWLLARIIDRALSHWARALPLDERDDDGDADTGTDTAIRERETWRLDQRSVPLQVRRTTKKHTRQDKSPGCTFAPQQKTTNFTEIIPGFTLLSNGSQQNPWTKYGRNCSDDSFLETLSVLRSHQSSRFSSIWDHKTVHHASCYVMHHGETSTGSCWSHIAESHGRGSTSVCADRVLTSLSKFQENHLKITVSSFFRASQTSLDFVRNKKVHELPLETLAESLQRSACWRPVNLNVDLGLAQPLAERSPTFTTKTYLCDFALMTNLSSWVIEGESPHHSSTPGANHHQRRDAVLQVGLCRQNADATVDVLREPLRFHGLVVLNSFRHESRHT